MSFQRARQADQKEVRRRQILLEAEKQIRISDYAAVNIAGIAEQLGIAKGTIFVYFPTKETLFLTVAEEQLERWFEFTHTRLKACTRKSEVVDVLLNGLQAMPLLPKLISILHGVLEHNVDSGRILRFKLFLRDRVMTLGEVIDQRLKWRSGAGAEGVLNFHTLVIGVYQMANPSPAVAEALENSELAVFRMDFQERLKHLLPLVFRNLPVG